MNEKGKQVKRLPMDVEKFPANNRNYTVKKTMCIARWSHLESFQDELGWGRTYDDVFKQLKKAYEGLNKMEIADAIIILHNLLKGTKEKIEKRYHPALMLCALFIIRDDEDETVYDEEFMKSKIEDWQIEGYDINDFFQLAWTLVPGFIEHYQNDLEDILKGMNLEELEAWKGIK